MKNTMALQMVFWGISGFRFPFAHFVMDGIQASELYTLFWEAVDKLQTFGFNAVYTCMDGAQSKRYFMKYNIRLNKTTFTSLSPMQFGDYDFHDGCFTCDKKDSQQHIKKWYSKRKYKIVNLAIITYSAVANVHRLFSLG